MNALGKVVEQCCFKVDISTSEYHPLALKVLGVRVGPVAQEWQKFDFKQYTKENIHPIFSILRSGYDALRPLYQRMFIDLAVYQADWTSHAYFYNVWRYVHGERDEDALVKLVSLSLSTFENYILYMNYQRLQKEMFILYHIFRTINLY